MRSSVGLSMALASLTSAQLTKYAGVNIAGFDFGCKTDGSFVADEMLPPLSDTSGIDGIGQMEHFSQDHGLNVFRLPVAWQYLTNNQVGSTLSEENLGLYDQLVQGCLGTGALCIIDIHNYARWDNTFVGQGGPTDDDFVSLWTQLATKYASESSIAFGVMNEPHDVPDLEVWGQTVQKVVTAIREAGATDQIILMPGDDWTSAGAFVENGSAEILSNVSNPNGSTTNLIFDVHRYLDSDNSGTHVECVTNNVDDSFAPLATWLRDAGRQAFLTETGGGNVDSCVQYMCEQLESLNENSDVYLGWVGWAAGSFDDTYELVLTPTGSAGNWQDTTLLTSCIAGAHQ
ncbi:Endoglucanase EG-II [Arachnomyces sp. PD_36]|nr:Endoglucanase EG-II [Arachnomyces sp. PD_36]